MSSDEPVTVYFNPRCSKCRITKELLEEQGIDATYYRYLDDAPTREQLVAVMAELGIDDPRAMMRTGESVYKELGLADADADALLDAMVTHPILIERPIVVKGDRAVIARPPERALDLF
jgi:arsenate reductase